MKTQYFFIWIEGFEAKCGEKSEDFILTKTVI